MCVCVGAASHRLWDITQRNMVKLASIFLKALKYYSSWPETISLSLLLDEDIGTAFINLCTSEGANIHFVEIIRVWMPRHDHKGKLGPQLCRASAESGRHFSLSDYCYKCWLIVVLTLLECISLEVKKTFKGGKNPERRKDNHQAILPLLWNNPVEGVQIMALMIWLAASETFHSEHHPYASDHQFVNQFIRQLNVP